jgi:ABC-2 type transport system ATP-binding protein
MNHDDGNAIRLEGVKAGTGGFTLGPLNFAIPRGLVTAVVGPNGSGKSTLFRTILGLEPAWEGKVEVLGTSLDPGGDEAFKSRIGFLAENPNAYENSMTVAEKAHFASLWYTGWNGERYRRLLGRFGIEEGAKLSKLSKGMRRKAELSIVMAHDPELLMLDEPSSGLDPFAWKILLEELRSGVETGDRTLLIATHVTEEVKRLADYILFLDRGRCLGLYEKDRLFDEWRTLLVQQSMDHSSDDPALVLRRVPGVRRVEESGPGMFRLEVGAAEEAEAGVRACGFKVLDSRRLEWFDAEGGRRH